MTEVVLDASVVLKWISEQPGRHGREARGLLSRFETGQLLVLAPPLLLIEAINVAARQWHWEPEAIMQVANDLSALGFELKEPDPEDLARWAATGLTAYDAAYVAVAERAGVPLITDDDEIVRLAPGVTEALAPG